MIWAFAAILTLAVVGALLWPLLRGAQRGESAADYDVAVYRDQLAEVDRNLAQGLIGKAEAEAARAEGGRRLLAADARRRGEAAGRPASGHRTTAWLAAGLLGLALPLGALGLYLDLGRPGADAVPFAERPDVAKTRAAVLEAQRQPGGAGAQGAGGELAERAADLAERLEAKPDNLTGWLMLGRTRLQLGQPEAALEAFAQAHERAPDNPRVAASYGEALVLASNGTVTAKAKALFQRAAAAQPGNPQVAYYLGLADFQAGRPRAALNRWRDLVADSTREAPWLPVVAERMAAAERQIGLEPGRTFAEVAPDTASGDASAGASRRGGGESGGAGPSREQVAAAEDLDPEQRQKMIENMVQRLAARLDSNPDDLQGWLRLARSYTVLERYAKARDALKKAADLAPKNVEVLLRYARAERRSAGNRPTETSLALSRRVLDIDPDNPEALWFVAYHHAREDDIAKARELFDRALAQFPESPQREELRRQAEALVGEG